MHPNKEAFIEGVDHVFSKWTALVLAVEHRWGGHETQAKRDSMVDEVVEYFDTQVNKRKQPEPTELEDLLLDVMDEDFGVGLEDSSEKEVSSLLCLIFNECKAGNFATVDRLADERDARAAQQPTAASQSHTIDNSDSTTDSSDSSDSSDDEEMIDT